VADQQRFPHTAIAGAIGGLTTVAKYGRDAVAARARAGQWQHYADRVDPERQLPPDELARRVEDLRRADMRRLALKSAQARSRKN